MKKFLKKLYNFIITLISIPFYLMLIIIVGLLILIEFCKADNKMNIIIQSVLKARQ